jgi:hypothetical protein
MLTALVWLLIGLILLGGIVLTAWYFDTFGVFGIFFTNQLWDGIGQLIGAFLRSRSD